jgi:hypothetical protein
MLFTMIFCLIGFVFFMGVIKLLALLFTIPFAIGGFMFKVIFGIICAIVTTVLLFSVIGVFALIVMIPIGILLLGWNRRML